MELFDKIYKEKRDFIWYVNNYEIMCDTFLFTYKYDFIVMHKN